MNLQGRIERLETLAMDPGQQSWEEIRAEAITGFRGTVTEYTGYDTSTWSDCDVMRAVRKLLGLDDPETRAEAGAMLNARYEQVRHQIGVICQ